jgi:hypothetical protein
VARRQLRNAQKRQLAKKLWHDGQTQERIAQLLGVSQPTIANWVCKFIKFDKLPPSSTVEGQDGKQYPRTKTRRRTRPTEEANGSETPQIPSVTSERPAQALAQQEPPQPHDTPAEDQSPTSELDEWHPVAGEQANSLLGSSPVLPAEADAEGWVNALQGLSTKFETLRAQASRLPRGTCWDPETRALGTATIRRITEILVELAAGVEAEIGGVADRISHADAASLPVSPPIADALQEHENRECAPVPSAEAPVGDMSEGDQLPSQGDGEGKPPHQQVVPVQEETAQDHTTPDDSQSMREAATMGHPAPQHDEEAIDPAADTERPSGVPGPSDTADAASVDVTRCGWCGGSQFLAMSKELGHIFCECGSVYNPSGGDWAPGSQNRRQRPLAPVSATGSMTVDEIERGTSEATATSTAGGEAFGDTVAAHQAPHSGPQDNGEMHLRECREIT